MGGTVFVGTSGWSYDHWSGSFYPPGITSSARLAYYASRFPTVEINATFYQLPSEHTVATWANATPANFRFAVKGSRFITHYRRIEGVETPVQDFLGRMGGLGSRLAVVLWQLPPSLELDVPLLERFTSCLPDSVRHAIEFRDETWLAEETFDLLRARGIAHVNVDSTRMPRDLTTTAGFAYVRLHGPGYHGHYADHDLAMWATFVGEQRGAGRDAYLYFNNDAEGYAPRDAARFTEMIEDAG